jgi:hypothetical protein
MTNSAPEVESQPAGLSEHKAFSKAARRAKKSTPKPTHPPEEKTPPAGQEAPSPGGNGLKPYSLMQSDGLHKYAPHKEGWSDTWICGFFRVLYRARGIDGLGWRTVLEVQDRDGNARPVIVLDADIGGQDGAWHKGLSDAGLMIHPEHRRELARYLLLECDAAPRQRFTVTTGLVGDAYVTHGRTIGASPEPMVYMGADRAGTFSEAGSAESWREAIGRYAEGNSRMILALCASLAAPLLPLSDEAKHACPMGLSTPVRWLFYGCFYISCRTSAMLYILQAHRHTSRKKTQYSKQLAAIQCYAQIIFYSC